MRDDLAVLWEFAGDVAVPMHWFCDDDTDENYCRPCAEGAVAAGKGIMIDGGWASEQDGCRHCCVCGALLDYLLTDYGASEELAHFKAYPPEQPLSRSEAYHIARMGDVLLQDPDAQRIVQQAARLLTQDRPTDTPPRSQDAS